MRDAPWNLISRIDIRMVASMRVPHRWRMLLASLMIIGAALVLPVGPASATCGNDLQAPCLTEKVRSPCWSCLGSFCAGCCYKTKTCNLPELSINPTSNLCQGPPSNSIPRPTPVNFMDGPNRVTEGYEVKVDLADAWIVIPRLGLPGTCDGISKFPSPMRTVFKDNNAPTVPDWAETSIYGSRLAINGSFFEVVGYYGTGDLHTEVCTHVFGYVVSNKELVRPEEQIKGHL
jgi:hypothetical protein